jgi:hypothetical protein
MDVFKDTDDEEGGGRGRLLLLVVAVRVGRVMAVVETSRRLISVSAVLLQLLLLLKL